MTEIKTSMTLGSRQRCVLYLDKQDFLFFWPSFKGLIRLNSDNPKKCLFFFRQSEFFYFLYRYFNIFKFSDIRISSYFHRYYGFFSFGYVTIFFVSFTDILIFSIFRHQNNRFPILFIFPSRYSDIFDVSHPCIPNNIFVRNSRI